MAPDGPRAESEAWYEHISCTEYPSADTILGIAVSGGVDSMALAALCRQLKYVPRASETKLSFQAFVVDHKARDGSTTEAQSVCRRLDRMGMLLLNRCA